MAKNSSTGVSKSFGLAGAKRAGEATTKALRKLFGRQPSTTSTANSAGKEGGGGHGGASKVIDNHDSVDVEGEEDAPAVAGTRNHGSRLDGAKEAEAEGAKGRIQDSRDESEEKVSRDDGEGYEGQGKSDSQDEYKNGNRQNHQQNHHQNQHHHLSSTVPSSSIESSTTDHAVDVTKDSTLPASSISNISAPTAAQRDPGNSFNTTSESSDVQKNSNVETEATITASPDPLQKDVKMSAAHRTKENQPLLRSEEIPEKASQPLEDSFVASLSHGMGRMKLQDASESHPIEQTTIEGIAAPVTALEEEEELTEEELAFRAERAKHLVFIEEALDMARLALRINETPVGCVLVHNDKVIARGMNATNVTRNGTRHAEFMAICALLSHPPKDGSPTTSLQPNAYLRKLEDESDDNASTVSPSPYEGNEDGRKSHLFPYGQKDHPDERVDRAILRECTLYVTVEPCVMCASLLRQLGIKKVFFGAVNDKFGGTGGVFSIHANSLPVSEDGQTASAHPQPPPMRLPDGKQVLGTSFPVSGGDGGNVEPGYEIEGGWGRDDAVGLLRRFYVQENGRAPVPRKKEGRAARLAAMMENDDGASVNSVSVSGGTQSDGHDAALESPTDKTNIDKSDGLGVGSMDG